MLSSKMPSRVSCERAFCLKPILYCASEAQKQLLKHTFISHNKKDNYKNFPFHHQSLTTTIIEGKIQTT